MPAPPPRRPWHRRKRAWAAVALWLLFATYVVGYVASSRRTMLGVVRYPYPVFRFLFAPAEWVDRQIRPRRSRE